MESIFAHAHFERENKTGGSGGVRSLFIIKNNILNGFFRLRFLPIGIGISNCTQG